MIAFTGVPGKTNHGQLSVFVTKEMKVLSPCIQDIPKTGLKDPVSQRGKDSKLLVNPCIVLGKTISC